MIAALAPMAAEGADTAQNRWLNIGIFAVFVAITLVIVFRASRTTKTASDYYAAGHAFTGPQNGIAISGDYLSAASFLGVSGAIAVYGYDGFLYSIGFLVAWLVALLLVAELLRNTGRYTMADVLSFRMRERPVRTAASLSTLAVTFFYLLAQMAGAGGLIALLLGITGKGGQAIVIFVVGALMILYVLVGGMRGTTWVQIIKAALLIAGTFVMTVWVLGLYGFNLSELLGSAADSVGQKVLNPGAQYGKTGTSKLDFISLGVALVLGTAGLPHVLMRFYTVPNAKEARRSVVWAVWTMSVFYLCTLVIGFGAAAMVGTPTILDAPGSENSAAPLLAYQIGGTLLLGIVAAIAFATILAVVAGLTLTASASFAHDLYANVFRKGATERQELKVSKITVLILGVVAILLGILFENQNIAFMVGLAFSIAASCNFPIILLSMYWSKLTTRGAMVGGWLGLLTAVILMILGPTIWVQILGHEKALFPYEYPALFSIAIAFIGIWVFSATDNSPEGMREREQFRAQFIRSQTGIGIERGQAH